MALAFCSARGGPFASFEPVQNDESRFKEMFGERDDIVLGEQERLRRRKTANPARRIPRLRQANKPWLLDFSGSAVVVWMGMVTASQRSSYWRSR